MNAPLVINFRRRCPDGSPIYLGHECEITCGGVKVDGVRSVRIELDGPGSPALITLEVFAALAGDGVTGEETTS